ncbi:hypothetical protein [Isoptericola sp. NPDC056605]|uniref:hypothetical protein n=1 Tax=Isoptericola sp. NPDC056605 TaxID=3345876 RepID=UPI003695E152
MNAALQTIECARIDALRTGDEFRVLGTLAWGRVRHATREVVFVDGAVGERSLALDDWGVTEVEVRRADHAGEVRIDILTWGGERFEWHSTCYVPPTADRRDLILANAPYAYLGLLEEMLEPNGPARYRIGTHTILVREV